MTARLVTCPTCKRKVAWSDTSPFRPFCSERCRLIDLGAWASEQHRIPADEMPEDEDFTASADPSGDTDTDDQRH